MWPELLYDLLAGPNMPNAGSLCAYNVITCRLVLQVRAQGKRGSRRMQALLVECLRHPESLFNIHLEMPRPVYSRVLGCLHPRLK